MLQSLPWPARLRKSGASGLALAPLADAAAAQLEAQRRIAAAPRYLDMDPSRGLEPGSPLHRGGVDLEYLRLHDIQMR